MGERLLTIALCAGLGLAGAGAWWLTLRAPLRAEAASLEALPMKIGRYQAETIRVEDTVESILNATYNVQRAYHHPHGEIVWLYLGYYSTARGGTPEHTPRACYSAHGWEVASARTLVRDVATDLAANEYIVELGGERRMVLFWYQSFRSEDLLSTLALRIDHIRGQLSEGRGDGALVRLSTPIRHGDREAARSRLLAFAANLAPEVARHWPVETSDARSEPTGRNPSRPLGTEARG
ncbi:MAG: EpsI family protein [Deltaproteobacteria bacterium]|nr:EpsI family protein [Deltaproteobacteria bacterium]MBW2395519.1 EpsI family protein [Deltaproteobacteria bacterium]